MIKIICEPQYKELLEEKFKPFEFLPLTLVQQDLQYEKPAIAFHISQLDEVITLLENITIYEELIGEKDGRYYPLKLNDIYFIEAYTKDTFAYTENDFYKIKSKLNNLETLDLFTRVNRSTLINTNYIQFIVPTLGSKLILHLQNNMEVEVNRAYIKQFKLKMGMKVKS